MKANEIQPLSILEEIFFSEILDGAHERLLQLGKVEEVAPPDLAPHVQRDEITEVVKKARLVLRKLFDSEKDSEGGGEDENENDAAERDAVMESRQILHQYGAKLANAAVAAL